MEKDSPERDVERNAEEKRAERIGSGTTYASQLPSTAIEQKKGGKRNLQRKSDDFELTALTFLIIALQGHGAVALEAWLLGGPQD